MPDENYQNLSNLSSNISYLLIETFEKYLLDKSQTMEDFKFAYFFKIKDPCKIFSKRISTGYLILKCNFWIGSDR